MLAARHSVYQDARQRNPQRWSGSTRNWTPVGVVTLNPEHDTVVRAATYKSCFPVRSESLLSRPDLAAPKPRRATQEMGGAEPPAATRSARCRARAWRGRRAPDLLRSEHRGTLVTSRRFAFPDIYAASTAASSIGEIVTEFKRQLP